MLFHWLGLSIATNKSKVQWRSLELDKAQRRISISLSTKAKQNFRPLKIKCKFSVVFFSLHFFFNVSQNCLQVFFFWYFFCLGLHAAYTQCENASCRLAINAHSWKLLGLFRWTTFFCEIFFFYTLVFFFGVFWRCCNFLELTNHSNSSSSNKFIDYA